MHLCGAVMHSAITLAHFCGRGDAECGGLSPDAGEPAKPNGPERSGKPGVSSAGGAFFCDLPRPAASTYQAHLAALASSATIASNRTPGLTGAAG
jgi:hypothetical protein